MRARVEITKIKSDVCQEEYDYTHVKNNSKNIWMKIKFNYKIQIKFTDRIRIKGNWAYALLENYCILNFKE